MDEVNMEESRSSLDANEELVEVLMTGGPPWGFNISGGSEFGSKLFVRKVAEDGIARKVGGLQEGDTLVYINGITCNSRAKAIETVKMGKNELRLKLRRNQSADPAVTAIQLKTGPKRSNSFYGSVVENMLESVSDDITSTHYSRRRNTLEKEMSKARKTPLGIVKEGNGAIDASEVVISGKEGSTSFGRLSPTSTDAKALSPPEDKARSGLGQPSPRNFQRVKIKSVNVTAVMPVKKSDSSEQFKSLATVSEPRSSSNAASPVGNDAPSSIEGRHPVTEEPVTLQTKSMDEGTPRVQRAWNDPPCARKASPPPVASKPNKARPDRSPESSSPPMTVTKARAMFEELSKSQENLDTIGAAKSESMSSPKVEKKEMAEKIKQNEDSKNPATGFDKEQFRPNHAHTKSLPLENMEGPRRDIRRPGSAPHRRSNRQIRPKSAHFASEEETVGAQNLPLGYAAVPSSRVVHGRKSIATTAPSASALYKKESSFRHSSEDLRPSIDTSRWGKKSSTLPANQMREAAKRYHKELMRKDPKFRYSLNAVEVPPKPTHLGSSAGGSSGSSLSSSQDQLSNGDMARRSSGPTVFTRACSTSSLDSSPGHPDATPSPSDEDNTILSRLLREQRLNSNGNLKRIEEEARSPRSKTSPREGSLSSSETVEPCGEPGKRTISIQTDFASTAAKKRESFTQRRIVSSTTHPFSASIPTYSAIETCIDDVDPALLDPVHLDPVPIVLAQVDQEPTTVDSQQTSHEKEPSADSADELTKINEKHNKEEGSESLPLPDPEDLPPPPEELLIASPPEREKPQRVINRKKRDQHSGLATSRNSSCVSTDSNVSTSTMDSGIAVRAYSMSDSSPRNSPTRVTSEFEDDYYTQGVDEGFKGSREELGDADDCAACQSGPVTQADELENEKDFEGEKDDADSKLDSSDSSQNETSKLDDLDLKKATLIESIRKKIEELKLQEQEISEEIKLNEDLGKRVRALVEAKATPTEFSKYELFIRELNKIVALLLSLTQRLHRYEQMLQDLDMSEEEDKEKRDTLISKIDKLHSQHEEACVLREVNDKRGENVANFLDKYFNEEEFADFQYYVDMKSQLALMQSEIKEKVKLGEERYHALDNTGAF